MTAFGMPSRSLYDFEARTVCPACECPDSTILFESGFDQAGIGTFVRTYYGVDTARLSGATYRLDQCAKCDLVYQHNVGSDELLRDLYTDWVENPQDPEAEIDTYRRDIRAPLLSRDAHEVMAAASYMGVPLQELRTLDFGMGWALWARIAAILGCQSYGSDLSQSRMDFARSHGVKAVDLEEIDTLQFDFINTEQVFEHLIAPLDMLRRLSQALRTGGILKISVPTAPDQMSLIKLLRDGEYVGDYPTIVPVQPLEHVNLFSRPAIEAMAAAAGLEPVLPSMRHRFAFLQHRSAVDLGKPKAFAKEMIRPWYQHHDRRNLFVWLRKLG